MEIKKLSYLKEIFIFVWKGVLYMLISLSSSTLLTLFFMALSASWLSGLLFLNARIPLRFVHIHIAIAALPSLVSLLALVNNNGDRVVYFGI